MELGSRSADDLSRLMMQTNTITTLEVAVAVINFNGATTLLPTLASIYALEGVRLAEVTVFDNASTDDSVALVQRHFPAVQVQSLPVNRGPNPARNAGLRQATTALVLIMDNDIVLAPDYVVRLAAVLASDPAAAAASGQIRLHEAPEQVQYNGLSIHYVGEIASRSLTARDSVRVSCISAGAALFKRTPALGVGGFDEDFFMGWEDGDLTFRLSLAGHPSYMVSEAVAYHMRRPRGLKWVRYQTRNRWWFVLKNYERRTLLLTWPALLAFQLAAGMFCLLKRQGWAFVRGTADVLATLPRLWRKRRAVQQMRVVPDVALLQGERFDLPGGLASSGLGRALNLVLNKIFYGYWRCVRGGLRRPRPPAQAA